MGLLGDSGRGRDRYPTSGEIRGRVRRLAAKRLGRLHEAYASAIFAAKGIRNYATAASVSPEDAAAARAWVAVLDRRALALKQEIDQMVHTDY